MRIEWSEGEVLKVTGVGSEVEEEVQERVVARIDGGRRCKKGRAEGIWSGAGRTGTARGEPCRVFALWVRRFMRQ